MSAPGIFDVTVTVALKSPFILAGVEASGVGIDTPALRDEDGNPLLPGDHLRGLLREALETLGDPGAALPEKLSIQRLFGSEATAGTYVANRGDLLLRDLTAEMKDEAPSDLTRIRIDGDTGTVAAGMLQVVELVARPAKVVKFSGDSVFFGTHAEADALESLLLPALRLIPYFGGARTAGFGEHWSDESSVTVVRREPAPNRWPAGATQAVLEGTFARPFLVDVERIAENMFSGGTIIPGAALKGALAEHLRRAGHTPKDMSADLGKALARLRISHAFPVRDGQQLDLPLPLSLKRIKVTAGQDETPVFRCDLAEQTGLIDGICADFQPDWKYPHVEEARRLSGRASSAIARLPRMHTAITRGRGVATDTLLFGEVARGAGKRDARHRFRFEVDATEAAKVCPTSTALFLEVLGARLETVGKTSAAFVMERAVTVDQPPPISQTGPWRILLETPAVLIDPDVPGFASVTEALAAYFEAIVPGAQLAAHYARRSLQGGYAVFRNASASYRPISLFEAGSCFLLAAKTPGDAAAIAQTLTTLRAIGLPVRKWDGSALQDVTDWGETVYLPENGYGRISIDDDPAFAITGPDQQTGGVP